MEIFHTSSSSDLEIDDWIPLNWEMKGATAVCALNVFLVLRVPKWVGMGSVCVGEGGGGGGDCTCEAADFACLAGDRYKSCLHPQLHVPRLLTGHLLTQPPYNSVLFGQVRTLFSHEGHWVRGWEQRNA